MKNKLIGALFLLMALSIGLYKYAYKPHPKTLDQDVVFQGQLADFNKFIDQESDVYNTYVSISGKLTAYSAYVLTMGNVVCHFTDSISVKKNNLTIKGRYLGYDDLMQEHTIDQCIIIE
jgi:hypothetical protein